MPAYCVAYNCKNFPNSKLGISSHLFPKDPELRKQWTVATQRKGFIPSNFSRLCSQHFAESAFEVGGLRRRLKSDVVPTIFDFPSHLNSSLPKKRRIVKKLRAPTEVELEDESASHSRASPIPSTAEETFFTQSPVNIVAAAPPAPCDSGLENAHKAPLKRKRGMGNQDIKVLDNALRLLQSSTDVSHDPYYTYGLHIANELRRYDSQTLAHVKREFADILFRADTGQLLDRNIPRTGNNHHPSDYHGSFPHPQEVGNSDPHTIKQIFLPASTLEGPIDSILP